MRKTNVGIAGIGIYLPDNYMTAKEIAEKTAIPENIIIEKFGIKKKYIPGPEDTTSYMGLEAAKEALEEAKVDPKDIDLIIWNGAQHKDYPSWLAGLKIADELGATNAWSFDMEALCGSMMAGMDTAKSFMLTHDDINTVLLVSGYRNVDLINLENPATTFMADIGAGGAAALLKKDFNKNVILSSSFKGDGSFSEDCVIPVGGTKKWPIEPEDAKKYWFVIQGDMDDFKKRLGEKTMPNFYAVIRESLRKSGFKGDEDIDYLAILHFKRSAHYAVLDELGLREDQSIYLDDYGHTGQNDQILSLKLGLESGKIKDGSVIVMVGAGLGFVWAATTIKWGKF